MQFSCGRSLLLFGLMASGVRLFGQVEVNNWAAPPLWTNAGWKASPSARSAAVTGPLPLLAVAPCRIMDTRSEYAALGFTGPFGPPALAGGQQRELPLPLSSCGIPTSAKAYSLNVTVVPLTGSLAYLTLWPAGSARPNASTLNSFDGKVVANAAVVAAGVGGSVSVFVTDQTHVLIDINGYYTEEAVVAGVRGPAGATGVTGAMGPTGQLGQTGAVGPAGGPGIPGVAGAVGAAGAAGAAGVVGPVGPTGAQGAAGTTGATGAAGATGAGGVVGVSGVTGATGLAGGTGGTGPTGAGGVSGATGSAGLAGGVGATGSAGPSGPSGAPGAGGLTAYGAAVQFVSAGNTTINSGVDISFSDNGPMVGVSHSPGSTSFTAAAGGVYEVSYSANAVYDIYQSIAVAVNGVTLGGSVVRATTKGNLSGSVQISLAAGDSISIRNDGPCELDLAVSPAVGAQINIKKIG